MKMKFMEMTTARFWSLPGAAIALTMLCAAVDAYLGRIDNAVALTIFAFLQAALAAVLDLIRMNAHGRRR